MTVTQAIIFSNEMLEYRDIRFKVEFCDDGEKMRLVNLDPIKPL